MSTTIASLGLVLALAAVPQLVIYYVTRNDAKQDTEYEYDYR